jgi:hypothetical protein
MVSAHLRFGLPWATPQRLSNLLLFSDPLCLVAATLLRFDSGLSPPKWSVAVRDRASHEVLCPSGDIPVGVRFVSSFPRPDTFHPWVFSALRRFSPPDGLPVLFHTSATYGIQSQRASVAMLTSPHVLEKVTVGCPVPVRKATDSAAGHRPPACGHDACCAMRCFSDSRVKLADQRRRVTHLSSRCRVKSGRRAHQQPVRFSPGS